MGSVEGEESFYFLSGLSSFAYLVFLVPAFRVLGHDRWSVGWKAVTNPEYPVRLAIVLIYVFVLAKRKVFSGKIPLYFFRPSGQKRHIIVTSS